MNRTLQLKFEFVVFGFRWTGQEANYSTFNHNCFLNFTWAFEKKEFSQLISKPSSVIGAFSMRLKKRHRCSERSSKCYSFVHPFWVDHGKKTSPSLLSEWLLRTSRRRRAFSLFWILRKYLNWILKAEVQERWVVKMRKIKKRTVHVLYNTSLL